VGEHPTDPPARLAALLLAALGVAFLAYGGALAGGFVFDDVPLLLATDCHHGVQRIPAMFDFDSGSICTLRPLRSTTHALEYEVYGLQPWGYHLTNVVLHALVVFTGGLLVRRLFGHAALALATALLFAVHPLGVEAVANIAGRRDVMACLFSLLAVHAWLSRRDLQGLAVLTLGLLSHESAAATGLVLGVLHLLRPDLRRWRMLAVWWGWIATFALWKFGAHDHSQRAGLWGGGLAAHVGTVLHGHLHYFGLALWPADLQADYSPNGFPIATGLLEVGPMAGLVLIGGSVVAAVLAARKAPGITLGLVWWFLFLLPSSQLKPHHELLAEHRTYIALWGLCGLGAAALCHPRLQSGALRPTRLAALMAPLLTLMLLRTWTRVEDWHSEETLWTSTLEVAPEVGRAHANLGSIRAEQGRDADAFAHFTVAIAVRPDLCPAYFNRATLQARAGRIAEAAEDARAAWRCQPRTRWRAPVGRMLLRACALGDALEVLGADDPELVSARATCARPPGVSPP